MGINFNDGRVYWQAHRGGGGNEMPDNTLASVEYGWALGGIPEIDLRLTADPELVCLHDDTLARTTDAPPAVANVPVGTLSLTEIQRHDAGIRFHPRFKGQKIPALREVLAALRARPDRLIYADLKNDDPAQFPALLAEFARLAAEFGVAPQLIACSSDYALNCQLKKTIPGLNVMHWIGYWGDSNPAREKMNQFRVLEQQGFASLDQVQLHLEFTAGAGAGWPFDIAREELAMALAATRRRGVALQVFPWSFAAAGIHALLDLGLRSFATDEPARFKQALAAWPGRPGLPVA